MAYTTIDNPELYFQVKTYSGTGSSQAITLDGDENMQPDFVWLKARSNGTYGHAVYDSVRGVNRALHADTNSAEDNDDDGSNTSLNTFGSDGFTLGGYYNKVNQSGQTFVAWCWKVNSSTASNSTGDITATVAANDTAGISIMSYTGTGSNAQTIGHSLSVKPYVYIIKGRTYAGSWQMFHQDTGAGGRWQLANEEGFDTSTTVFGNTVPTNSVLYVGATSSTDSVTNKVSETHICYAFRPIQGFSKFGEYNGNAATDGNFIWLGFRPALVIIKGDNSEHWSMYDNKREGYNVDNDVLYPDDTDAEGSSDDIDFLSNGFKIRRQTGLLNDNEDYIYMAWAEAPFVNSKGVPCNAR